MIVKVSKKTTKTRTTNKTILADRKKTKRQNENISLDSNQIRIFSYNVSWESLSGLKSGWELCNNAVDPKHPRHHSVCTGNISQVIEENPSDFITLQEAAEYQKIIDQSPRMNKMLYKVCKSGKEVIITFWERKWKLYDHISGEFEKGRPWLTCFFGDKNRGYLALINVHFGHYTEQGERDHLNTMMQNITEYAKNKKIDVKRFIISGDFNYDIKNLSDRGKNKNNQDIIQIGNKEFYYYPKHILTCCIRRRRHYDHVIDTKSPPMDISIPDVHYMASDHKPILAVLASV